jgi:hypothetical protein
MATEGWQVLRDVHRFLLTQVINRLTSEDQDERNVILDRARVKVLREFLGIGDLLNDLARSNADQDQTLSLENILRAMEE